MSATEFIKSYWRISLSLAVTIAFLIYSFAGEKPATLDGLAKLIGFALVAILGLHLAESIDIKARFKKARDDSEEDIRHVLRQLDRYSTYIVEFRGVSDYAHLFGDLTQKFHSYNPHQFAHQSVSLDEGEVIENMLRRYKNPDFKEARFLICVGDEYGRKNFVRFMLRLHQVYKHGGAKAIKRKVRVRYSGKSFVAEPTYHLQHQRAERMVIELRLSALTVAGTPVPRFYLVSNLEALQTHLRAHFEREWGKGQEVNLDQLFPEIEKAEEPETAIRNAVGSSAPA